MPRSWFDKPFADWAVRSKLLAIALTSALVPILVGVSIVAARDLRLAERDPDSTQKAVAKAAARFSAADLAFDNPEGATRNLARLDGIPDLQHAALYDEDGRLFAFWGMVPGSAAPPRIDSSLAGTESQIEGNYIDISVPVEQQGARFGTLRLRSSTEPIRERLVEELTTLLLYSFAIALLAVALALSLERWVSRPVLRLARVASRVGEGDYSVRAPDLGRDEIGTLSETLNHMLAAIEKRQNDAEEAIRVRDEFIGVASHELKTPLTNVRIQMQLLRRNLSDERPAGAAVIRRRLELVERALRRFDRLVDDMLDVSSIRAGRLPLHLEELDLAALTGEVVETFRPACERDNTQLVTHLERQVVGRWDRLRLEQVLINLLANATKFGAGRPIEIEVSTEGDRAKLVVTDHGIGIAPKDRERIFGLYERAVSTRAYGGLGLGLYITRNIVEELRGSISLASEVGRGSSFTVVLPRAGPGRVEGGEGKPPSGTSPGSPRPSSPTDPGGSG